MTNENQLALAQALAASGHVNEAENYFLNLWQSRPGDGLINLQLARLERSRGREQQATEYYRAAVFGTWDGDALTRRRDTRPGAGEVPGGTRATAGSRGGAVGGGREQS